MSPQALKVRKDLVAEQINQLGKGAQITEKQEEKRLVEGFMADIFRGRVSFDEIFPWPKPTQESVQNVQEAIMVVEKFLREKVNSEDTDNSRDIHMSVIQEMSDLGFFRLKIPKEEWGGWGLDQTGYIGVISYLTSYYGPSAIMVSADNTIGCKFPVLKYGTEGQKRRYLPELTKWPSGFCFTEEEVGSDPARMKTYALRVKNKGVITGYRVKGQKWYTTNSVLADGASLAKYLSVVVRIVDEPSEIETETDPEKFCFGLFIIPTSSEGVDIGPRNEFCGMRGIYNANPRFNDVLVNSEQLIGGEGNGFRIALQALNTGRIAIAASCVAIAKQCWSGAKSYAQNREQWGGPIIDKELIGSNMLAKDLCNIFAFNAMTEYAALKTDKEQDTRLEATACKVFSSEKMWAIVDNNMQIHGGIGYETFGSASRRKKVFPVERFFRDARPNRIFEGSTQILSQWFSGKGIQFLMPLARAGFWKEKFLLLMELAVNQIRPVGIPTVPGCLKGHLRFVRRNIRRFSRYVLFFALCDAIFFFMLKLPVSDAQKENIKSNMLIRRQLILWRWFWIVSYLEAMSVVCSRAVDFNTGSAIEMADGFCGEARLEVKKLFRELIFNNDKKMRQIAKRLSAGECDWFVHSDIIPLIKVLDLE